MPQQTFRGGDPSKKIVRDDDSRVRVRLDNNVAKKYIEFANLDTREFSQLPDGAKAARILEGRWHVCARCGPLWRFIRSP